MRAYLTSASLLFFLQKTPLPHVELRPPPPPVFGPRQTFSACVFACLAWLFGLLCTSACKTAWRASRGRIRGQLKVSELRRASPKGSCSADGYKQDLGKCCATRRHAWPTIGLDGHNSCCSPSTSPRPPLPPPTDLAVTSPQPQQRLRPLQKHLSQQAH